MIEIPSEKGYDLKKSLVTGMPKPRGRHFYVENYSK